MYQDLGAGASSFWKELTVRLNYFLPTVVQCQIQWYQFLWSPLKMSLYHCLVDAAPNFRLTTIQHLTRRPTIRPVDGGTTLVFRCQRANVNLLVLWWLFDWGSFLLGILGFAPDCFTLARKQRHQKIHNLLNRKVLSFNLRISLASCFLTWDIFGVFLQLKDQNLWWLGGHCSYYLAKPLPCLERELFRHDQRYDRLSCPCLLQNVSILA